MVVAGVGQRCWDTLSVVAARPPADTKVEALRWEKREELLAAHPSGRAGGAR